MTVGEAEKDCILLWEEGGGVTMVLERRRKKMSLTVSVFSKTF